MIFSEDKYYKIFAKTAAGLEDVCASEIERYGGQNVKVLKRGVAFEAKLEDLYKLNVWVRTAFRFLLQLHTFVLKKPDELYDQVMEVPWEECFAKDKTFSIDSLVFGDMFRNSMFVSQRVKDAIADRFRKNFGSRPSVDRNNPDVHISVHMKGGFCTISLDSSGESLHKRGYRMRQHPAPISELLAAGIILKSGWKGDTPLVDLFCGSGTFLAEAAMIQANIPPAYRREEFSFMNWLGFDREKWAEILDHAESIRIEPKEKLIFGSDNAHKYLAMARENIEYAGFKEQVRFELSSAENFIPPEGPGVMVANPPYGERLQLTDLERLYKKIGDAMKTNFAGYEAFIISPGRDMNKSVGLRTSSRTIMYNGSIECQLLHYSIYKGSKRSK